MSEESIPNPNPYSHVERVLSGTVHTSYLSSSTRSREFPDSKKIKLVKMVKKRATEESVLEDKLHNDSRTCSSIGELKKKLLFFF